MITSLIQRAMVEINFFYSICLVFLFTLNIQAHQHSEYYRNIPANSIVEGSTHHGGLQPDYIFDIDSPAFNSLNKLAIDLRVSDLPILEKITKIIAAIRQVFANHNDSSDPVYLNLMRSYREMDKPIPLSRYVECGAGVCRENSMILHHLMSRAGIPNSHVYFKYIIQYDSSPIYSEDHGVVVFQHKDEQWIADSYYKQFNGYSFTELMSNKGILKSPQRRLPFAELRKEPRAILHINSFPKVINPIPNNCHSFYSI